jgi:hypothetical protein
MLRVLSQISVVQRDDIRTARLSRRSRFFAAVVGVGLLAALGVASQLRPEPRGFGTHEQLGLPPCSFATWFGRRCPACGMTTAWAHVAHGQWSAAVRTHVSGTVLAILAAPIALAALVAAVGGRESSWVPDEVMLAGVAVALAGAVVSEWLVRLTLN